METRTCARCGKLFSTYKSTPICQPCEKKEEELFEVIKKYVEENPLSTTAEISRETGTSVKRIVRYIKEGRLEVTKGMAGEITCDACGKPVPKGRYCDSCRIKIDLEVKDMFQADAKKREAESEKDSKHKFFTADSKVKFRKKL